MRDWGECVPHAGDMRLLDEVISWDAQHISASAHRHTTDKHPLRSAEGIHAVHLAEYGAQACAVHGALLDGERGIEGIRQGRLVSLRDLRLHGEYVELERGQLLIKAQCLIADNSGAQYSFSVSQGGQELASGRVAVIYTDA